MIFKKLEIFLLFISSIILLIALVGIVVNKKNGTSLRGKKYIKAILILAILQMNLFLLNIIFIPSNRQYICVGIIVIIALIQLILVIINLKSEKHKSLFIVLMIFLCIHTISMGYYLFQMYYEEIRSREIKVNNLQQDVQGNNIEQDVKNELDVNIKESLEKILSQPNSLFFYYNTYDLNYPFEKLKMLKDLVTQYEQSPTKNDELLTNLKNKISSFEMQIKDNINNISATKPLLLSLVIDMLKYNNNVNHTMVNNMSFSNLKNIIDHEDDPNINNYSLLDRLYWKLRSPDLDLSTDDAKKMRDMIIEAFQEYVEKKMENNKK